ncbi:hypothetical protein EHP00_1390 [Ecytonucleospora hepatopenaei]|uniref:Uncharacterized protein n=1 Tax=Ecytonucleospora hepatopenaei TaxID=646526 RepID=A0A1W0E8W0_9MICR|nr:hypothetical protein EHP00_1390 [Ecytonucleospora hepatopenaei]
MNNIDDLKDNGLLNLTHLYEYVDVIDILEGKIYKFAQKDNFAEDLKILREILERDDSEKLRIVFYTKILAKILKKPNELKLFYAMVIEFIDRKSSNIKESILLINLIKIITNRKYFISTVFNLMQILHLYLKNLATAKETVKKQYYLDDLKVSNDSLKNIHFNSFVINEILVEIQNQMNLYSTNIGYPEIAFIVTKELRKMKGSEFKEVIAQYIKEFTDNAEFIEEKRKEWLSSKTGENGKKREFSYDEAMRFEKNIKMEKELN